MKRRLLHASLVLCALLSTAAGAETLYAVSMRTYSDPQYKGVEGNLYVVATDTGVTRLLAALTLESGTPIGLDGLAIHPKTRVFYGLTPASSAHIPHTLVTVDPKSGFVKPVGDLRVNGTDMDFDSDGTLYVWLPETGQFGTINLDTGAVTPKSPPTMPGASKGGIAMLGAGRALVAATGGTGTLDTVDLATGAITTGPTLSGAPFPDLMNGLTFSPKKVLYGVNTNGAHPPLANLVTIDVSTGKVTSVGALPNETDALSFGPDVASVKDVKASLEEWRLPLLVGLFLIAVVTVIVVVRSSKA